MLLAQDRTGERPPVNSRGTVKRLTLSRFRASEPPPLPCRASQGRRIIPPVSGGYLPFTRHFGLGDAVLHAPPALSRQFITTLFRKVQRRALDH
jgi:hypothetical protein